MQTFSEVYSGRKNLVWFWQMNLGFKDVGQVQRECLTEVIFKSTKPHDHTVIRIYFFPNQIHRRQNYCHFHVVLDELLMPHDMQISPFCTNIIIDTYIPYIAAFLCCLCDGGQPCETQPLALLYYIYLPTDIIFCQQRERQIDLDHQVFIGCTRYYVYTYLQQSRVVSTT